MTFAVDFYRETCVYDPTADGTGGQDGPSNILQLWVTKLLILHPDHQGWVR